MYGVTGKHFGEAAEGQMQVAFDTIFGPARGYSALIV